MAVETIRIDDIDGTQPAKAYTFALNGEQYSIDLSDENFKQLQDALKPFISKAQKGGQRRSRSDAGQRSSPEYLAAVREWARENGLEVADRGRIKQSIQDAYAEATGN